MGPLNLKGHDMKHLTLSLAVLGFTGALAGTAVAEIATEAMVRELAARGYSQIEVDDQGARVKVEARYRNREIEMYFDPETGVQLQDGDGERRMERARVATMNAYAESYGEDDDRMGGDDDRSDDSSHEDDHGGSDQSDDHGDDRGDDHGDDHGGGHDGGHDDGDDSSDD